MPIQGLQFTILSGQEGHQSYQATGSFIVYNPNDGVAYVATDRTATGLSWDYKVPSQSGGRFPGPINSYLSIFYLDQSGSGQGGQIVVYASPDSVSIPHFWSIGRALQGQTTSMDVVQGAQPGNPGSGIARLWVDSSGHLHILLSDGTDRTLIDTTNWGTIPLGADLWGTTGAAHIGIQNNSAIWAYDGGGTIRNFVTFGGEQLFWAATGGGFRWVNQPNTVQWMALSNAGNLSVAGTIIAGGNISGRDILASRGNNTGVIYFDSQAGTHYLYWDGTSFNLTNQLSMVGNLLLTGGVYPGANAAIYLGYNAGAYSGASIPSGGGYCNGGMDVDGRIFAMRGWVGNNTSNANAFLAPNIGDNRGQGLAWQWATWSSVDHARQYKLPVAPVTDPLKLVRSITGYYYAHASMKGQEPILRATGEIESNMTYGFAASEVNLNIPEMAGEEWVDSSRLLAILWEAVKELDARIPAVAPA